MAKKWIYTVHELYDGDNAIVFHASTESTALEIMRQYAKHQEWNCYTKIRCQNNKQVVMEDGRVIYVDRNFLYNRTTVDELLKALKV